MSNQGLTLIGVKENMKNIIFTNGYSCQLNPSCDKEWSFCQAS